MGKRELIEFAAHLLPLRSDASHEERVEHNRRMLLRALNLKTTVAFIGSGVSRAFDYPSWDRFAHGVIDLTGTVVRGMRSRENFASLRAGIGDGALDPISLLFLIGACKKILIEDKRLEDYYRYLETEFAPRRASPAIDPFAPLLELPIRRFATSNYDCEIECALSRTWSLPLRDFGLDENLRSLRPCPGTCRRSFTQRKESLHQIAMFSLAGVADNENTVFHCHGRFDDPESIIATEEDYQNWYLSEQDGATLAFQQSVQLVLGSNPVLFIGYGLRDEDLLRHLRQLAAVDPGRKGSRPIFALLPKSKDPADQYHHDALFDRYGLHVVPYDMLYDSSGQEQQTRALHDALQALGHATQAAHVEWVRKPKLKKLETKREKPKAHLEIQMDTRVPFAPLSEPAWSILQPGVVALVGPSGSGKSFHAYELARIASEGRDDVRKFDGTFYWNAHYANETVIGMDYALSYFDPDGLLGGSPQERIQESLRGYRHLLIIDGCERLLHKGKVPGTGFAYSVNFRRLLRAFADRRSASTVILAGRLWPADLDELMVEGPQGAPFIRRVQARRITSPELRSVPPFRDLCAREVSALCSLLRGHHFGLDLAYRHLKTTDVEELQKLNQKLSDQLPNLRLREMMKIVLEDLDEGRRKGLASEFLERLGLFLNPICKETLVLCHEEAWKTVLTDEERKAAAEDPAGTTARPRRAVEREAEALYCALVKKGILLPTGAEPGNSDSSVEGYVVHSTARRLLFQPDEGQADDPLPAVGLSGFTSGRLGVAPDRSRCAQIHNLFDELIAAAASSCSEQSPSVKACLLCRDAFGLVRTRMEANTAARWTHYEKYLCFGIRVTRMAKLVSREFWTFCEHADARDAEHREAPLYGPELAWLYNDTALALSDAGYVLDACPVWEQAYEITRLVEDPVQGGGFHLEVLLNLTFNFLEMGFLPAAKRYLDDGERFLLGFPDDDFTGRIEGLRGLMEHLSGNYQAACDHYDLCLERLRPGNNLRAQSVYLKHKADVKIVLGKCDEANLLIRNSRALAEAGIFPELVANAKISEGHRLFRLKEAVKARVEYNAVLREARRLGAHKLEVRVLTALARLALDQKDLESARKYAIQSLSLANELGLGLRQTHGLVVLGLITLEEGQNDLGVAYLRHAKRLADKQEYGARSREAEDKLLALDVDPDGTEYPPRSVTGARK